MVLFGLQNKYFQKVVDWKWLFAVNIMIIHIYWISDTFICSTKQHCDMIQYHVFIILIIDTAIKFSY